MQIVSAYVRDVGHVMFSVGISNVHESFSEVRRSNFSEKKTTAAGLQKATGVFKP